MKLSALLKGVNFKKNIDVSIYNDIKIEGVTNNSLSAKKGSLFFAVKGNNFNGNEFIKTAVKNGAVAVVTEENIKDVNVPIIRVKNVREEMSRIAYKFFKPNANRVKLIGVVGTNGKTSTAHFLRNILEFSGEPCGVIGTTGTFFLNRFIAPDLTTPDSICLYETLKDMAEAGVKYCVMELSAHAIDQHRADGCRFDYLIFTNCTQDHLDYFKDFSAYEQTKLKVFTKKYCKACIVNLDSKTGVKILNSSKLPITTYGIESPTDVFAININTKIDETSYVLNLCDEILKIKNGVTGLFNVYNQMGAATCAFKLGVKVEKIEKALNELSSVEGRMEFVENYNGANIFIDYAHTPDGLENTLKAFKAVTKGRLIAVFGCGGNRDKLKRKIMGQIAGSIADFTVITTDNPRYEEPFSIIREIEKGIRINSNSYITIQDRTLAIGYAITTLKSGDTLVVLGKGAEKYQDVMGIKTHYDDKEVICQLIAEIGFTGELI